MFSRYLLYARRISRRLWVRAALISTLAVVAAAISPVLTPLIPLQIFQKIEEDTVRSLLDIIANSMLAVTTFSLTIMVTTHLTASQQVTPRAHRLLREDTRTQTVMATFVGAFVFAVTGIVMLQTDVVGKEAFPVLYIATLLVLALVILAILRWIGHLASLGSVEETTRMVEETARTALRHRADNPFLGGRAARDPAAFEKGQIIRAEISGFVQHIETGGLSDCAAQAGVQVLVIATPGDWVDRGDPLARVSSGKVDDDLAAETARAFTMGTSRTFEQDAAFGIGVLTEIAERALSPSMNDPGTALDIIARLLRIFEDWKEETEAEEPDHPDVFVPALDLAGMIDIAFDPIARDGADMIEVGLRLQKALAHLARHPDAGIARGAVRASARALARTETSRLLEEDKARLRAAAPRS